MGGAFGLRRGILILFGGIARTASLIRSPLLFLDIQSPCLRKILTEIVAQQFEICVRFFEIMQRRFSESRP
jgi:hypothetical protein